MDSFADEIVRPKTLEFHNHSIRTVAIKNEVWFVAKDVAMALGYPNHFLSVPKYCKESQKKRVVTSKGPQAMVVISLNDVQRLVTCSQLPDVEVEEFGEWVRGAVSKKTP